MESRKKSGGRPQIYCSRACNNRAKARSYQARSRAAVRGTPYTRAEIARRDGGECHLCGLRVDLSLSGHHQMGPTIDHVIPLSLGGVDGAENVALAHWICNARRGARPIEVAA
jgi:5-methylcytosine-specific restriction endonuclease McrA